MSQSQLILLTEDEIRGIDERVARLRSWYGAFDLHPINACMFDGGTLDICALDFIFYELGGDSWGWDDGITHAVVWGNVVVQQFGFQWCKFATDTSPRHFAVRNPDVPCVIFPWTRLYELVENPGNHHSAHEYLLLSMLTEIDRGFVIPDGWHPAFDAINQKRGDFPVDVVAMLNRLYENDPNWIHRLGMYPYEWDKDTNWDMVRATIQS